ncbi:rod shape determining protein RodA [Bacillus pakistanensis]|uniref:Rod shape determining protein RodA n=1 Tax=Rossellomorea pakistanensis TaxID=992288 RepID=A0ABS2N9B9_9BACI|nr:FtsW/RodA/SpoVE family cell cycle protein [Bacillus pakistanensis]MBM7584451.1 rod shape determining protein RodA [Bacillus pakistanensis]
MEIHKYKKLDLDIIVLLMFFMIISCLSIYSAEKFLPYEKNFAMNQAVFFIIGFIVTAIVYLFDFEQIKKLSMYLYFLGVMTLFILRISPESIAPTIKGIKAWFSIPGIGTLQPSEFMKVFLILFLAKIIHDHNEKILNRTFKTDFMLIAKMMGVTLVPLFLILKQPDAGTGMVIVCILLGMIFVSGVNWKIITAILSVGLCMLLTLVYIFVNKSQILLLFLDQYQLDRIYSWLDPFGYSQGIGYQLRMSILASGSGMIYGKGYGEAKVAVPEAHSDFIFSVITEEFGFVGACFVLCLYFLLIYKIIVVALKNKGEYENLMAAGIVSMLLFHVFENVGMVIGAVPITGIPLPLISYGGSSVLGNLLALSLVNNISATTNQYMFANND